MSRYTMMAVACLVAGSTLAQAAGDAPPPTSAPVETKPVIPMEEPLQGDFWAYQVRDEISGTVKMVRKDIVTEVTPAEISVRFSAEGKEGEGLNVYDRSWNLKNAGAWRYQPNDGSGIHSPLKTGETWSFAGDDINAGNGNIWKRSGRSKVVGQETVTTKAGTFETFKIEVTLSRRPTNDPTRKMEITAQTWYAPAIDHWVRRTFVSKGNGHLLAHNTIELVEYGRKQ
jgi:hypothetical protein